MCLCPFQNRQGELFLCVGTAKDLSFEPKRRCTSGFIHVYRLLENGTKFQLLHKTPIQEIPGAMTAYYGRLLVGGGKTLRIFEMGKKKLLKKCENKVMVFVVLMVLTFCRNYTILLFLCGLPKKTRLLLETFSTHTNLSSTIV